LAPRHYTREEQINMAKRTKQPPAEEPLVQGDEAQLEQRRRDTEALMNSPEMQAEMAACRRAFEEQQRQAAEQTGSDEQADEDEDNGLAAWAEKLVAERTPDRLEDEADEDEVIYGRYVAETAETPGVAPMDRPVVEPEPEPVWVARGQRAYPPADPDDAFDVGRVVDVEVRLYSDKTQYRLTMVEAPEGASLEEGGVEDRVWVGPERDGWGAALAMRRVKIDKEADYGPVNELPRVHPGELRRQKAREEYWASMPMARGRGREIYRDFDVTGQPRGYTDGVNSW
jgi:hypothetical protein